MKKIFKVGLLIATPLVIVGLIYVFIFNTNTKDAFNVITVEQADELTKEELLEQCEDKNSFCKVEYSYNNDIEEGKLIADASTSKLYVYSKGEYPIETHSIKWGAAGDLILYSSRPFRVGNTYDYSSIFANVADKIANYDIASYTQETLPIGCDQGYPLFCSPTEIVTEAQNLGFDISNAVSNHSLDQGASGVERAIDTFEAHDMVYLGLYRQGATETPPKTIEKNNIKVGLLAYTCALNGLVPQRGLEHTLKVYNPDLATSEVEYLNNQGVDFIVATLHCGPEYNDVPNQEQIDVASHLANLHVDVVVGSHTHSINPVQHITSADGSHQTLVAHSLGNFNAAQHSYIFDTAFGGILEFELVKEVKGDEVISTVVTNEAVYPIFHDTYNNGLIISPLSSSKYAHRFEEICAKFKRFEDIQCYN